MTNEWSHYVGDPCYVIDDDRWGDFCDTLWAEQHRIKKEFKERTGRPMNAYCQYPITLDWEYKDEDGDTNTAEVEVWNSPFGDGCWGFANTVRVMTGWVAGNEIGVDAGLIAVVPRGAVERDDMGEAEELGILFNCYPELETGENLGGHVLLDGFHPDNYMECDDCGEATDEGNMCWCDGCGASSCSSCWGSCGCSECEDCGTYYEERYSHYDHICNDCGELREEEE